MPDDARRRVSRRSLLAGLGGGAALTATGAVHPTAARADDPDPSPAQVVAAGLGKQQAPRWNVERSVACRTPGHAQWVAEPGLDAGSLWLGDSTFEIDRAPFQYARELARRNPGIRVVYDKGNWGGGGDRYPNATPTPTPTFAAFVPGDTTGRFSQVFNAGSWAAAGGRDLRQPLPGISGYGLTLPASARYTPWGAADPAAKLTRGAVGVDVAPNTWLGPTAQSLLSQEDASGTGRGTLLRIRTDGRVELRLAQDPAGIRVIAAVTTVPVTSKVADGTRCAVMVEFDLDRAGKSVFTPLYRLGGHGNPWLPLGDKITLGRQTGVWLGNPGVPWTIGGGGSFRGDVFEAFVRKVDRTGPDMVPRLPHQWTAQNTGMKATLQGGRTYWLTNLPWPQHGLDDFDRRTDRRNPGDKGAKIFVRTWNSLEVSDVNVYSPMDMVPQLPFLMAVLNSAHNETTTGGLNAALLRSVLHKVRARAPGAQPCVLVQNPTLRADTSNAVDANGNLIFDQSNTTGNRRSHDFRIAQYAALGTTLGFSVLDSRSDMVDVVRAGGNLADLLETTGVRVHPNTAGAIVAALGLLNQTTTTDFGTTGVLP